MSTIRRASLFAVVAVTTLLLFPARCPAPLIWTKGEGWRYERSGVPVGKNPKEQLQIARDAQAKRQYRQAIDAYRRLISRWPTAYSVPDARLGLAECLSAIGYHHNAFKEYQKLIEKNPNSDYFDTALQRQFDIGKLFLGGERVKFVGVRFFPGVEKAVEIFAQIVKNGPYSKVGPAAQYHLGLTYEKQKEYLSAVKAYEQLIERYPQDTLAEVALFAIALAYKQEAGRAEYDQDMANKSITAFTDFVTRYPKGDRSPLALRWRHEMHLEQAYGLYRIGQFYEKQRATKAAIIYYNAVIEQNPRSPAASDAQKRLAMLEPVPALPAPKSPPSPTPPAAPAPLMIQ
jgi:outer membrane protein assembly factor BamD